MLSGKLSIGFKISERLAPHLPQLPRNFPAIFHNFRLLFDIRIDRKGTVFPFVKKMTI